MHFLGDSYLKCREAEVTQESHQIEREFSELFLHQNVIHLNFQIHEVFQEINSPVTHKSLVSPSSRLCISHL